MRAEIAPPPPGTILPHPVANRSWWQRRQLANRLFRGGGSLSLFVALLLAVATVAAVAWLNGRLQALLEAEAGAWLAGDFQITAPQPFGELWHRWRQTHPEVTVAESVVTTTVARRGDGETQLVALRAIGPGYPLRGTFRFTAPPEKPTVAEGEAWIDARLAALMNLTVGDALSLGRAQVRVAAILTSSPEQGADFFAFLPEVVVSLATLDASGLIAPGSRATWRWHLLAPREALTALKAEVERLLAPGERLLKADEAQPAVKTLLEQVQRLLRLATIAAVVLAAVAVALAARRLAAQLTHPFAVVRALGATRPLLVQLFALRFAGLTALAALVGLALGWVVEGIFAQLLAATLQGSELPAPPLLAAWPAFLLAVILVAAFVVPWLFWLLAIPPVAVLRRVALPVQPLGWTGWAVAVTGLVMGVTVVMAGEVKLAVVALAVTVGVTLLFGATAWLMLRLLFALFGRMLPTALRLALLFLVRQPLAVAIQVSALALGLTILWLLVFVRSDLIAAWRYETPPDAPNRFLLNVLPEQVDSLRAAIERAGLTPPTFWPLVRGRMVAINGQPIPEELLRSNARAERLAHREFNLTWGSELPDGNAIVAGKWHGTSAQAEASVEAGLAQLFGLQVGDQVTFAVAGEEVTVTITSVRSLRWESMRPNFFFITTPQALRHFPATFMAALFLPEAQRSLERHLADEFPNVTILDVERLQAEFAALSDKVSRLLEAVFAFTLSVGGVVLFLGWAMGDERRAQQVALLRALGLQRVMATPLLLTESAAVGLVAALLSVAAATGLGQWLASALFDLPLAVRWLPLAVSGVGVTVAVALLGWWRARPLLAQPPLAVLRGGV